MTRRFEAAIAERQRSTKHRQARLLPIADGLALVYVVEEAQPVFMQKRH